MNDLFNVLATTAGGVAVLVVGNEESATSAYRILSDDLRKYHGAKARGEVYSPNCFETYAGGKNVTIPLEHILYLTLEKD